MKTKMDDVDPQARLREKAETQLKKNPTDNLRFSTEADMIRCIHELEVHQIELEIAQQIGQVGSWQFDLSTQKIRGSAEAKRLFGLDPGDESFTLENIEACIPDRERVHQALLDLILNGTPYDLEYMVHPADGSLPRTISAKAGLKKNRMGDAVSIIGVIQDITVIRNAEESKQKSETLYRSILEASPDDITIADMAGFIRMVSPNAMTMFGYGQSDEIMNRHVNEFLAPEDHQNAQSAIAGMHAGVFSGPLEYRGLRKDGSVFDIEVSSDFIRSPAGEATSMIFIIRDVTERKQTEVKLKNSTTLLSNLILNLQEGIMLEDSNRKIFLTNQLFCDMFGIPASPESMTGVDCTNSAGQSKMLFKDPAAFIAGIDAILADKKPVFNDHLELTDGRHFERDYIPTFIDNNYNGHLWRYRDITQRQVAEDELRKLSQAVEQSPIMTCITDLRGTIEYVNPWTLKLTGYSADELIGKNAHIFGSRGNEGEVFENLWQTINSGREWKGEFQNRRKNGSFYWVMAAISPIFDSTGKISHYLAVEEDITARKVAEAEIQSLNATLALTLDERTAELAVTNASLKIEIEQRINVSATLTEALDRLHKIADQVPGVVYQFRLKPDGTTCFPFVSEGIRDIYQVGPEEVAEDASGTYARIHPDDFEQVAASIRLSAKNLALWREEYRVMFKDGKYHWVLGNALPQGEADGSVLWHGFITDITQQKEAGEVLKKMTARLELATHASGVGVWDFDFVNDVLVWDDQMFALYGIQKEDFSGAYEAWQTGLHPDDKERGDREIGMALNGEKEFDTEFRVMWPDGTVRHIRAIAVVQRDGSGRPVHLIGTNWDITEQKRTKAFEQELLQLSLQLTGIRGVEISDAIDTALRRIGEFLEANRVYIYEFSDDGDRMTNTFEWCNEGIGPRLGDNGEIPVDFFPIPFDKLKQQENIIIPSVVSLPDLKSREREVLIEYGIRSMLVMPLLLENKMIGFVALNYEVKEKNFEPYEIINLNLWSNLLSGLINNQRNDRYLEQTRSNYETFFNTIDDFLFVLDEQGNILHTNDTVLQRLGYSPKELLGNSVLMLHPAGRREEAGRIVGEMLSGSADFCPVPLITKSGTPIAVETRIRHGSWDGKSVIFGVSKDVSKIVLSEEKFSKAFHSNFAIMAISSFEHDTIIDVNGTFLKTLGYTRDDIFVKKASEFIFIVDPQVRNAVLEKLKQRIPVKDMEVEVKTKTGEVITGLFSADSIFVGDDLCLFSVLVDITDRIQAEKEINRARNEADKANQAKSEFISRMSHELRTPMNSILGFAQLMGMGELNPSQRKGVNHILNSGKHLLGLINEVLDISRIEAGRLSLDPEAVLLESIILETLDLVHPDAVMRNLTLVLEYSPANRFFVMADRLRFRQVLLNLIHNAVKYNRKGGSVILKTELMPVEPGGIPLVRISVTDTGLGIKPDDLGRLFLPFERIGAEKTGTEGTGLGLMLVKELMEAMGGVIGVTSRFGEGSTFWIELPFVKDQKIETEGTVNSAKTGTGTMDKTGTILYIEDNIPNAELVEDIITNHRPAIRLITSMFGKSAVKFATECRPDLILLDLDLPDMHGSEVMNNLQADAFTQSIPVIIISADATPGKIARLKNAGAQDYLPKPIDIRAFLKVVDEWIDRSS